MARVVVVGGGPNGLVAAIRLARVGRPVVVLEQADAVGGLARGDWLPHTAWLLPEVAALAGVTREASPPLWGARADGTPFCLDEDAGWRSWCAWAERYRAFARGLLDRPAPRLRSDASLWPVGKAAFGLRRLGEGPMMELLRVGPLSAEDALAEHVDDPAVRAVAAGAGLLGTWMGPLSPTGAAILLLDRALREPEVVGGGSALAAGLEQAARAAGVEIRTGARVVAIEPGAAAVLDGGERVEGSDVLACVDPRKALLDLVPGHRLPVRVEYQAQEHRVRGLVAVVRLELAQGPEVGGRPVRRLHTAAHPFDVERAFDAGKRRRLPDAPPVLLHAAPDGKSATVWVHGVPTGLGPEVHDALVERVVRAVERVWPGARDAVRSHTVHTPDDLARDLGLTGGHLWHGELALDQLWSLRPGLDLSGHRTPVSGLFLGSSGTAPCGGITGRPGWAAADAVVGS